MNMKLQIRMLKERFERLNPNANFDDIDLDLLDNENTLPENRQLLLEAYPQYKWEIPINRNEPVRDLHFWKKHVAGSLEIYTTSVRIKAHPVHPRRKSRSGSTVRKYPEKLYGRIQVTADKKWIGHQAKIIVRIPIK